MPAPIRVLVVANGHRLIRDCVLRAFHEVPAIEVVAEAIDGIEAIELARRLRPDVALLAIEVGEVSGMESCAAVASLGTRVVMLSLHGSQQSAARALRAGATGFVSKHSSLEDLSQAVQLAAGGYPYLCPTVMTEFVETYTGDPRRGRRVTQRILSDREEEVVSLMAAGVPVKQIASRLGLSAKTVETHRRRAMTKLGIDSVVGLVKYAVREGLATLE